MGKIFYLMGKSASGKDTIYSRLMSDQGLRLCPIVMYTTRPPRFGEQEGKQYHFVTEETMAALSACGKVVESRCYDTACGKWYYFTVDDGSIDLHQGSYLAIGTLESFQKLQAYYGTADVIPVYIEVNDRDRLYRAWQREQNQESPDYGEMCRRFLADQDDFSEEKLLEAGILYRFANTDAGKCTQEIKSFIIQYMEVRDENFCK